MKLKIGDTVRFKKSAQIADWSESKAKVIEISGNIYRFERLKDGAKGTLGGLELGTYLNKLAVDLENK